MYQEDAVSLLTGRALIEIDLFSLRMCNSIAPDQPWPCAARVCVFTRPLPQMFTEYADPLSSSRHTRARQSSFTPICLCSPETIQPRVLASTCCTISRSQTSTYAYVRRKGRHCCEYELLGSYEKYLLD